MSRSSETEVSWLRCWVMASCWDAPFGLGQVAGEDGRRDPPVGLIETPGVDLDAVPKLVLRDRLAVDAADRREMVVVVVQAGGDREDEQREDDDQPEPEVQVEVPSVLRLPRGSVVALDDGFGTEGHGVGRFLSHGRLTPGMEGRGMVHRASESSCPRPYRRSPARVRDGRMSASVTRVAEPPSATSKEASRKRATRSRSKSPARRYSASAAVVSKIGPGTPVR